MEVPLFGGSCSIAMIKLSSEVGGGLIDEVRTSRGLVKFDDRQNCSPQSRVRLLLGNREIRWRKIYSGRSPSRNRKLRDGGRSRDQLEQIGK